LIFFFQNNFIIIGGLRPNTVILGFYDNVVPEDKLRSRSFLKRRWLKSSLPTDTSTASSSFHQEANIRSSPMEGARAFTLNSFNNSTSMNGSDIYSIPHFAELRQENEAKELDVHSYVQIIKDALHLNKSVCLARNFHLLQKDDFESNKRKVFVDIWPVCLFILKHE
jgi:hypothetical protein